MISRLWECTEKPQWTSRFFCRTCAPMYWIKENTVFKWDTSAQLWKHRQLRDLIECAGLRHKQQLFLVNLRTETKNEPHNRMETAFFQILFTQGCLQSQRANVFVYPRTGRTWRVVLCEDILEHCQGLSPVNVAAGRIWVAWALFAFL